MISKRFAFTLLGIFLLAGSAQAQTSPLPPHITITGTGVVAATPDMASVTIGVLTTAETASDALKSNNLAMGDTTDMLVRAGIERRDMATRGFAVQPRFDGTHGKPVQVGFDVTNSLLVRLRDIRRVGEVLDAAVKVGSNQIGGIAFDIADKAPLLEKARAAAVADAKRAAQSVADAAGLRLVRIISVSEASDNIEPRPMAMRAMAASSAVPIQAGEYEVKSTVTIIWEIAPTP